MPLNDRECPACGVAVYRTHSCRGARREALTLEQIADNVAAVKAAIEEARNPAPPLEQLVLEDLFTHTEE